MNDSDKLDLILEELKTVQLSLNTILAQSQPTGIITVSADNNFSYPDIHSVATFIRCESCNELYPFGNSHQCKQK